MPRASTKITKEMGIYEQAAYQAASAARVEVMTTQMDPAQMRALLEQSVPPKQPHLWLPLLIALSYVTLVHFL